MNLIDGGPPIMSMKKYRKHFTEEERINSCPFPDIAAQFPMASFWMEMPTTEERFEEFLDKECI